MSLIERAANKLAGNAGTATIEPAAPAGTTDRRSTIERVVERLPGAPADDSTGSRPPAPPPAVSPPHLAVATDAPRGDPIHLHLESLRLRGFVSPDGERSQIAQEFRIIKRPLLANAFGRGTSPVRNGKRVMITSALPGEGKSFCAINLALSIAAERDHKVLLVDADVARPSLPRELGIEVDRGLMDCLADESADLAALILDTDVEKLSLLPAGRTHAHTTELLASEAMSRLLENLSTRFPDTLIVFDSPPLLPTTEARVLAAHMGQILVVVEAGRSPRDSVETALAMVSDCEVVGLVLNKSRIAKAGYYGGYGYGYGNPTG